MVKRTDFAGLPRRRVVVLADPRGRNRVPRSADPNYHISHDLADHAIAWMQREKEIDPARPFFLYVAPSATHAPHMAPKEWIDKFKGQFDIGWDRYREITLERQKKLGVVPPDTKLTLRPESLPAWDSLNASGLDWFGWGCRTCCAGLSP